MEATPAFIFFLLILISLPPFLIYKFGTEPKGSKSISLNFPLDANLEITKESGFTRAMRKIGLSAELKSPDPTFDQKYYLHIPNPAFSFALVNDSMLRSTLESLFNLGVIKISTYKASTDRESRIVALLDERASSNLELHSQQVNTDLQKIAEMIKSLQNQGLTIEDQSWTIKRVLSYSVFALVFLVSVILDLSAVGELLNPNQLFALIFALVFILCVVCSLVVFFIIRGYPSSHVHLLAGNALLFIMLLQTGQGVQNYLNNNLDYSTPAIHRALVTYKREIKRKKSSDLYYLYFDPIIEGKLRQIEVKKYDFEQIVVDRSKIKIALYPGAFGAQWVNVIGIEN